MSATFCVESTRTREPKILDLVRVHRRVGNQDLGVLDALRLADANLLVEDEAFVEVRLAQGPAFLLNDLDVFEVGLAIEAKHRVDAKLREEGLVRVDNLGRERGRGN